MRRQPQRLTGCRDREDRCLRVTNANTRHRYFAGRLTREDRAAFRPGLDECGNDGRNHEARGGRYQRPDLGPAVRENLDDADEPRAEQQQRGK